MEKINNIAELKQRVGIANSNISLLGYYSVGDGGGGEFYWDSTSTETDNGGTIIQVTGFTTGRWKRVFSNYIDVRCFGSKGDGSTDDSINIQNAINYLNSINGGSLFVSNGNYKITQKLFLYSNIKIIGDGNSNFIFNDIADYGIRLVNTFSSGVNLLNNATEGSNSITLTSGGGSFFSVGDYIYIEETNINFGNNFTGVFIGSVISKTADTITLSKPLSYSFSTSNDAKAYYFSSGNSFAKNVSIRNINMKCVSTSPSNFIGFLDINKTKDLIIENNTFENCNGAAVIIYNSLNVSINNNSFSNIRTTSGVSISAAYSVSGIIKNNKIEKSAFGINLNNCLEFNIESNILNGYKDIYNGRGIKIQYNTRHCSISNNKINNTGLYGIYVVDSSYNNINGNDLFCCGTSTEYAISVGGYLTSTFYYNTISNNIITGVNNSKGFLLYSDGASANNSYILFSGNVIKNVTTPISIYTSSNVLINNIILNAGIGENSISINEGTSKNLVANNVVKNSSSGFAISSSSSAGNNFIINNNTKNETLNLHSSDNVGYNDNTFKIIDESFNSSSINNSNYGGVFIKPTTGTNNNVAALVFGYNSGGSVGSGSGAGIYVQSSSSYGTRMILGTTSSFGSVSSKVYIDEYGSIGLGTLSNPANTILNLVSTSKGFAPPRMTTTQKNAISSPYAGLMVYDTTLNKLCVYTTAWETITSI